MVPTVGRDDVAVGDFFCRNAFFHPRVFVDEFMRKWRFEESGENSRVLVGDDTTALPSQSFYCAGVCRCAAAAGTIIRSIKPC